MPLNPGPVVIAEDDAAVRSALRFALEADGLTVRTYDAGRNLSPRPICQPEGCLVVDYYMPGMNGSTWSSAGARTQSTCRRS